ncbi:MAG: tetratricopeptide repeat protein [Nibricoccus sp.]
MLIQPQSEQTGATASNVVPTNGKSWTIWCSLAVLALIVVAVFANGVGGEFVFDDEPTILNNRSIRAERGLAEIFSPPTDATTLGRPLANATFAVNYAISGLAPWSYHVVNITIHAGAALVLFGVVRRLARLPAWAGRFRRDEVWLALAVAGLWAVHPLQTESVSYVVQRVESLAGLCYLLTLYCFLRSVESPSAWRWQMAAVTACLVGAGCKEIIVSAPLVVLLADRTWVAATFREAWMRRKWMYAGMALSWVVLAALVVGARNRGGTAGFGTASSWQYLLTQCGAIVHYLKLVVWPTPLIFDHGNALVEGLAKVRWEALGLAALAAGTLFAIWRRSSWGVAGFWFLAILAPSSSVVPVLTQTAAEHRMYLPLAAVVVVAVFTANKWFGRWVFFACAIVCLVWGGLSVRRNADYATKISIWSDTVKKRPENWRARNNLALALAEKGHASEAVTEYEKVLAQVPGSVEVRNNYANALLAAGRAPDALREIDHVVATAGGIAELVDTRGMILAAVGRKDEALECFREALRLKPELDDARRHLTEIVRAKKETAP